MNEYVPEIYNNEDVKFLVLDIWRNRFDGTHGWTELEEGRYLTVEPMESDGEDYVLIQTTDKLDYLGYAFGNIFSFEMLFENEIEALKNPTA